MCVCVCVCVCVRASMQVQSEFILESERESFIEQVREVIETADERGLERDTSNQVNIPKYLALFMCNVVLITLFLNTNPTW